MKLPRDYIIFPLDLPNRKEAMRYVGILKDSVGLFKVGLELFIAEGPGIISALRQETAAGIFLDLKLHDIPETMRRAFLSASAHGAAFVTVHCEQGQEMLKAAADAAHGETKILAVTVLTSLNSGHLVSLGYREDLSRDLKRLVLLKTRVARDAGCHGVVCSGHEVGAVKKEFGRDFLAVTPGIRPKWSIIDKDDQQRIVTPADAVGYGADYLVIGRPIRDARDPKEACERTAEEIASVL
ncbi:MAG: orotidine-5'-phosphate decarboxylase [Desulfobacteraceae bacterium]|jgi:orotidine-5'-phosphate decarboxylase|nr:MAG: orotidine-5'-phosphate decarboxylase [Desulfobacteraceae bacterium]